MRRAFTRSGGLVLIITNLLLIACGEKEKPTPELGVSINGVRWAESNIGARGVFVDSADEYGEFYTFGDDPCPSGWRMPLMEEWAHLSEPGKVRRTVTTRGDEKIRGMLFTDRITGAYIFLPMAGYRLSATGRISGRGTYGNYWSASLWWQKSSDEGEGYSFVFFDAAAVDPADAANFNYTLSVRCVRT